MKKIVRENLLIHPLEMRNFHKNGMIFFPSTTVDYLCRLYRKKGRFFWVQKKGPSPSVFFFWCALFFLKGTFFNVPFFPPSFFIFWEALFSLKGCFFPFFWQISWFCCFYACCQPLFFIKIKSALRAPFFYFFLSLPFFCWRAVFVVPFFLPFFFSCPSFDIAYWLRANVCTFRSTAFSKRYKIPYFWKTGLTPPPLVKATKSVWGGGRELFVFTVIKS